jgi:hypothetical protein
MKSTAMNPYIKIDRTKLKLVDGFKIRNTLDDDFVILHGFSTRASHYLPKFYIPQGEWWLDHRFKDEMDFFVRTEDTLNELMEALSYHEAREELKKIMCLPPPVPPYEVKREAGDGYSLVMVDGKVIRQYIDPEFVFGGHDLVYPYVPKGEIWLDVNMDPAEVPYVLLHEKVERDLMAQNKSYDMAHDFAVSSEKELRRNNGVGAYPGEEAHPWKGKTNEELAQEFYFQT